MKYYCHKDSFTNASGTGVVDELRVRNGTVLAIPFDQIVPTINGLVIPAQRGAPNTQLTVNAPSKTIERGIYTGGSVSVNPQNVTAVLTAAGNTVTGENGRPMSSVIIPAANVFSYAVGTITPADKSTSISISGLSFTPVGFALLVTNATSKYTLEYSAILNLFCAGGTVDGCLTAQSGRRGKVTGASVSFGSGSVSISNITAVRNGSSVSPYFRNSEHSYFVWG